LTKDRQEKLFAMFKRLHNHVEGTGVGLYMVKKIVENAGKLKWKQGRQDQLQVFFKRHACRIASIRLAANTERT
jgi:light-regulated signal transduction histidine kinase (bacteriophytochrome)